MLIKSSRTCLKSEVNPKSDLIATVAINYTFKRGLPLVVLYYLMNNTQRLGWSLITTQVAQTKNLSGVARNLQF